MSPNEQRVIHDAATDAATEIIAAAGAMHDLAISLEDERQAALAVFAIKKLSGSQDGLHRLFVELNKNQPNFGGQIHARN